MSKIIRLSKYSVIAVIAILLWQGALLAHPYLSPSLRTLSFVERHPLNESELCDFNNESIRQKALEITQHCWTDEDKVRAISAWIKDNISYALGYGGYWDAPASETLRTKRGMCFNISNLQIAMARALGIEAEFGIVDQTREAAYEWVPRSYVDNWMREKTTMHVFPRFKIGDRWVTVDLLRTETPVPELCDRLPSSPHDTAPPRYFHNMDNLAFINSGRSIAGIFPLQRIINTAHRHRNAIENLRLREYYQTRGLRHERLGGTQEDAEIVNLYWRESAFSLLPPAVVARIEKAVTWVNMEYDKMTGARSIIINLDAPIEVAPGKFIRAIKIKGVIYRDESTGVISKPKMEDYRGRFGRPALNVDFTADGSLFTMPSQDRPTGCLLLNRAEQEYLMTASMFDDGLNVNYAFGLGEFANMNFGGQRVGFVILGIEDPDDARVAYLPKEELPDVFERMGRALRKTHRRGYIHSFAHPENYSVSEQTGDVIIHDTDNVKRVSALPSQIAEVWYRINDFVGLGYPVDKFYPQLTEEEKDVLLQRFFSAYFGYKIDLETAKQLRREIYKIKTRITLHHFGGIGNIRGTPLREHRRRRFSSYDDWDQIRLLALMKTATANDAAIRNAAGLGSLNAGRRNILGAI